MSFKSQPEPLAIGDRVQKSNGQFGRIYAIDGDRVSILLPGGGVENHNLYGVAYAPTEDEIANLAAHFKATRAVRGRGRSVPSSGIKIMPRKQVRGGFSVEGRGY